MCLSTNKRSTTSAGAQRYAGRGGAALVGAQAHEELEIRGVGARSAGQSGVSGIHPHRDGRGARRKEDGAAGEGAGTGGAGEGAKGEPGRTTGRPRPGRGAGG